MAKAKYYSSDKPCVVTGQMLVDLHHVKSRGSSGNIDEPWNLLPIIHPLHQEIHTIGLVRFAEKYQAVHEWLLRHDWYICPLKLTWKHD